MKLDSKNKIYDVIVIGSGPAGALASYELAKRDLSVLLFEKQELPRYKCCGGGVTVKASELLDFSISDVVREKIDKITITVHYKDCYTQNFDHPVIYTVMRNEFDYLISKKAQEYGVELLKSTCVKSVELNNDSINVYTSDNKYTAKFVIGAGGVYGIVQKCIGILKHREYAIGIVSEAYPRSCFEKLDELHNTVFIDFTHGIRRGYGWIFPKSDHISPGVYVVDLESMGKSTNLRALAEEYFKNKGIYDSFEHKYRAYPILRGGKKNKLHCGRALLVGDEGGLCDPLTGEGLYYGMKSAIIAADTISSCIQNNGADLSGYTYTVNREITSELKYARLLALLLYKYPSDFVWQLALKNIEKSYEYFASLVIGEISYKELWHKTIGKFCKSLLRFSVF